ncbi:uncharacterized protein CBL_03984 [Carabus blaptoides fortunei]
MRFALRSRRGPHVPVGHDAKKSLKREIERRIDLIPRIIHDPQLLNSLDSRYILCPGQQVPAYYHRLKAVDDVKMLEREITKQDNCLVRHPSENLRAYLLTTLAAPLNGSGQRLIHQFCDLYEHARHDPNEFGEDEYQEFNRLLFKLLDAAKLLKSFSNSRRSSPSRTPQKLKHQVQEKQRNLLDPSRLRPPNTLIAPNELNEDEILRITTTDRDTRPTTLTVPILQSSDNNETSV